MAQFGSDARTYRWEWFTWFLFRSSVFTMGFENEARHRRNLQLGDLNSDNLKAKVLMTLAVFKHIGFRYTPPTTIG